MTSSSAAVSAPAPVPLAIARSMLSLGIDASFAFWTASASDGLPSMSPPPSLAATVTARASLVKSLPRLESTIAFLCLIEAHLECPDIRAPSLGGGARALPSSAGVGAPRDPDIQAIADHLRQADLLDPAELRELIPSLLILEAVAVGESPPFGPEAIAALRAANRRLRDSAGDAAAAASADDEFHRRLTAGRAKNQHLQEVIDLVREALRGYERRYMTSPERVAGSVDEHEAIVAALEIGDHALAANRVRANFTSGLPTLEAQIEDPGRP